MLEVTVQTINFCFANEKDGLHIFHLFLQSYLPKYSSKSGKYLPKIVEQSIFLWQRRKCKSTEIFKLKNPILQEENMNNSHLESDLLKNIKRHLSNNQQSLGPRPMSQEAVQYSDFVSSHFSIDRALQIPYHQYLSRVLVEFHHLK